MSLPNDDSFFKEILLQLPDAVLWAAPYYDLEQNIVDFEIQFSNKAADKLINHRLGSLQGLCFKRDHVPSKEVAEKNFINFLSVYQTGEENIITFYAPNTDSYVQTIRRKYRNGVLSIVRDRETQRGIEQKLKDQSDWIEGVLQHLPTGIMVCAEVRNGDGIITDYKIVRANLETTKLFQYNHEDLVNTTVQEIVTKRNILGLYEKLMKLAHTDEILSTEHFVNSVNKWLAVSAIRSKYGLVLNFLDISEAKRLQLEFLKASERIKAVFNAAQSGMFTFRPVYNEKNEIVDFCFTITNITFASYVNQTPDVLIGELGSKWFPGYLTNGVFDMYKHTYQTGEMQRCQVHYNVDGINIYLDLQSIKMEDEVLVTFTDYTVLKNAQLQLERNIDELKRSNKNLEEFAYIASHDMKEPVRKIKFFTSLLSQRIKDKLDEKDELYLKRIENATLRMQSLIDDLLKYSQISLRPLEKEIIDLNEVVKNVLEDLEVEAQQNNAIINVDPLPTLSGYKRQLHQLFQNLISNALKYSKAGVAPQIGIQASITSRPDSTHVSKKEADTLYHLIVVSDNGIGFEQEYSERIFQMFQRLHGHSQYNGTGVGLSIVKKVVDNHNGSITATSKPGVGSSFYIYLPAQ